MRRNLDKRGCSSQICQLMLRLCPPDFREELGNEVMKTHLDRLEEVWEAGLRARTSFMMTEIVDFTRTAIREWKNEFSSNLDPKTRSEIIDRETEMLGNIFKDIRYSFRTMLRRPGFSIVVILTLVIGIGATTSVFSILENVLLHPLPFNEPDRIVAPRTLELDDGLTYNVTINDYLMWRERDIFENVSVFGARRIDMTGIGDPALVMVGIFSDGYFETLQLSPVIGRLFSSEEYFPGSDYPILLSYGSWQRWFGEDPDVLGKIVTMRGVPRTIVGVMPPEASIFAQEQAWEPLQMSQTEPIESDWDNHSVNAIARLKDGVDLNSTREQIVTLAAGIEEMYPDIRSGISITLLPLNAWLTGVQLNQSLWLLFGVVGFVLLIGCVNIANLLMAKGSERFKELTVRRALGAHRGRLIRLLLTENCLLAGIGGTAGILLSPWIIRLIVTAMPAGVPRIDGVGLNSTVLGFAVLASIASVVLFGLAPALRSTSRRTGILAGSSPRTATVNRADRRSRNILMSAELALSLILLTGAGLMLRSLGKMGDVDPGFEHTNLLTLSISLPQSRYPSGEPVMSFYQQLKERAENLPGITSATVRSFLPLRGGGFQLWRSFLAEGRPEPPAGDEVSGVPWNVVGVDHFKTIGLPVLRGRTFTDSDNADSNPVIIVNERYAEMMFDEEDALGKRVRSWRDENIYREIVGIVSNVRFLGPADQPRPIVYVPHQQNQWRAMILMSRVEGPANSAVAPLREILRDMDPDLPVTGILSMEDALSNTMSSARTMAILLGVFAVTALLLAAVGIFGVLSYVVATRTREIGIRMAVGANRSNVINLVMTDTLKVAGIGLVFGIAGSQILGRLLQSQLFEVSPGDPTTLIVMSVGLVGIAMISSYIPARRAASVDPVDALRQE